MLEGDGPDPQQQEDAIRVLTGRVIELAGALGRIDQALRDAPLSPEGDLSVRVKVQGIVGGVLWTPASSGPPEPGDAF
jgi:hypothetical protein